MQTIGARNLTSHAYDEEIAKETYEVIVNDYIVIFQDLLKTFENIIEQDKNGLR